MISPYDDKILEVISINVNKDLTKSYYLRTFGKGKIHITRIDDENKTIALSNYVRSVISFFTQNENTLLAARFMRINKKTMKKINTISGNIKGEYIAQEETINNYNNIVLNMTNRSVVNLSNNAGYNKEEVIDVYNEVKTKLNIMQPKELEVLKTVIPSIKIFDEIGLDKITQDFNRFKKMNACSHSEAKIEQVRDGNASKPQVLVSCAMCKIQAVIDIDCNVIKSSSFLDFSYVEKINKAKILLDENDLENIFLLIDKINTIKEEFRKEIAPIIKEIKVARISNPILRMYNSKTGYEVEDVDNKIQIKFCDLVLKENNIKDISNTEKDIKKYILREKEQLLTNVRDVYSRAENEIINNFKGGAGLTILGIVSNNKGYGVGTYAKTLKGSKEYKIIEYGLDKSEYYKSLSSFTIAEIESFINRVIKLNLIELESKGRHNMPCLKLTKFGDILKSKINKKNNNEDLTILTMSEAINRLDYTEFKYYIDNFNKERLLSIDNVKEFLNCYLCNPSRFKDSSVSGTMSSLFSHIPKEFIPLLELEKALSSGVKRQKINNIIKVAGGQLLHT